MNATLALEAVPPESSGEMLGGNRAESARPQNPDETPSLASRPEPETAEPESAEASCGEGAALSEQAVRARRVRESLGLPPGLRERLASLIEARGDMAADGAARLPLEECLQAIEESLPEFLRADRADAARLSHPAGDQFFKGSEEISDEQAEELARRQLANSGLLRGQRVRVAD